MNCRSQAYILAGLLAGLGCGGSSPTAPPGAEARFLFEVELQNHDPRFPPYWLGLVVEADGAVYAYDRTAVTPQRCDHYWHWVVVDECRGLRLSESQLDRRHAVGRSLLTEIPSAELAGRRQQAARVADGPYQVPNLACNDTGVLSLVSFAFDSRTDGYLPVVLRLEGEQMRQNLSPGAGELAQWLLELAEEIPFLVSWRNAVQDCRPD